MRQVARVPDPLRPPRSLAERSAAAWLDRVGSIPFDALVERVAHALYLDELRHGGWALDLGFLGPGLFVREAAQVIEAANGVLWLMEPSAGGDP